MTKSPRVDNEVLLSAALELMRKNGKPLVKRPGTGRSMLYSLSDGHSVRVRTCNDHLLIILASRASADAELNIEGTDWLLIAMPEVVRTPGKVLVYLVPTDEAVATARQAHRDWLAGSPNTKGNNTTWNLWFGPSSAKQSGDFATKWAKYRLQGEASTGAIGAFDLTVPAAVGDGGGSIKAEIDSARRRIALAAGVAAEAVRISIDFGG